MFVLIMKEEHMNSIHDILSSNKVVLIDFYADWCGPCRMIAPIIEEIKREKEGIVKVMKVNVDEEPELAEQYKVMSIPTLLIIKEGKLVKQLVGYRSKADILNALDA
ncbi:MAG: thioredoxin [Bacilli bacterium]|nr:thioredoxin [Bacilli bacterium]